MATSVEQRRKELGLGADAASSPSGTVAARKADLGIQETVSVKPSLANYVVSEMLSSGLSPAKTVVEPLQATKERSDARSYAKISADLAAKNTEKYGTSDQKQIALIKGSQQRIQDIARLQSQYEQATADAGVYDSKAQTAKSATERAVAYENAAAARKKAEEAKTELERIGGNLRSSGVANFLGKVTTRDASEPTTGFTAKTGDDGVDAFISQMQANAAAANTANKTKDNAWSRGAMHSIGSGIAATPGLVTGALGSKSDFADRSMDFANDLAYQSAQEIEDSKEGKSKFKQGLIDLGVTGLQMATDIATGAVTGGSSLIPMAIRVFGNSGLEAYNATGDYTKAAAYGLAAAGAEVLSEKLFSSNALMKKYFGEGLLNKAGSKLYGKLMQTAAGRAAIEKLVNATGKITSTAIGNGAAFVAKNFGEEAFEEIFAGALNPLISRIYDENALTRYTDADSRAELIAETLYEGLLGGTLGLIGGAVSAPAAAAAKAAKAQAEAQAQTQETVTPPVTPPVTPQMHETQTSATLTEAAGVPFTNPNAETAAPKPEAVQNPIAEQKSDGKTQKSELVDTPTNASVVPFTNAELQEERRSDIIEENGLEEILNAQRTEQNESDIGFGDGGGERSVPSSLFRRYLSGNSGVYGKDNADGGEEFSDNRSEKVKSIKPEEKLAKYVVSPKSGSVADVVQKTVENYGFQCYVISHDAFSRFFKSNAPALRRTKSNVIYVDESTMSSKDFINDPFVFGLVIGTHESMHAMFDSRSYSAAYDLADTLFHRLSSYGKERLDSVGYGLNIYSLREFICAFASTYQKYLFLESLGLISHDELSYFDNLFSDGTTSDEFYEEIAKIHDEWMQQYDDKSEGNTVPKTVEAPIVSSQTEQSEQTASAQISKQQTLVDRSFPLVPSYTSDEQVRVWNAEDRISALNQEKDWINRRIAAEQDAGKIGTSAKDLARLSEIDTELKSLTDELNTIRKTAQDRTSVDVDEHVPESVNTESAETTTLRARLFRVEKAIEIENNPDTIKLLQDEAQRLRDEIGARHAEQSVQDAPERTDEEASRTKFGTPKESTSAIYSNPNKIQYESMSAEDAINAAEDYVNNQLGDYNTTVSEKADMLMRLPSWGTEQELASEILRIRALNEGNKELARTLRDRHIQARSENAQAMRLGYALQSASERADNAAVNLLKDIKTAAESKLAKLKAKPLNNQNGKKISKLMLQISEMENGLEKTHDAVDRIDWIYHSKDASEGEKNIALRNIIREIANERGYKYSDMTNDILSRMDAYHLYDIALSSAVGISSDAIPTGFFEGMNTVQYIAQLLNPQTIERNIIGNFAFGALENAVTGNVAAVIDHFFLANTASRQLAVRNRQNGDILFRAPRKNMFTTAKSVGLLSSAAKENAKSAAEGSIVRIQLDAPSGEFGKYDTRSYQTFGGIIGTIEQLLSYGMATTDAYQGAQSEGAISESIKQMPFANRFTEKMMNEAARRGSSYRTWHRQTELGSLAAALGGAMNNIPRFSFGDSAGRTFRFNGREYKMHDFGVGDFVMKYGRFAGTAVQTALEYTPAGFVKAIYNLSVMKAANEQIMMGENRKDNIATNEKGKYVYGFENLTNEEVSVLAQREAAEAIARPIVGGTAVAAFYGLAKLGLLLLTNPYDKDEAQDKRNAGLKDLQLNFSALGRLISGEDTTLRDDDLLMSVSDLAPFDTLAGIGVEMSNLDAEDDLTFLTGASAFASGAAERFGDLSVMDAIQTYARDARYAEKTDENGDLLPWFTRAKNVTRDIVADRISSDITGFIPGPLRKSAAVFDDRSRDVSADTPLGEVWNSFRNVVPGLRNTLPEKLDAHGNPVTTGLNGAETALNSLLAPYSVTRYHASSVQELSAETGKYPSRKAPNYYTVEDEDGNKTKYELSAADKRQWMSDYGEAYDAAAELLLNSGNMDKLTPKEQAEIMGKIGSYATATAKQNYYETIGIPYAFTQNASQMDKAVKATETGIELADYFIVQKKHDEIDDNNPGSEYDKSAEFNNWLDNQDWITDTQENILRKNMQFSGGYAVGAEVGTYDELKSAGITETNSKLIYDTVAALKPPSGDDAVREWQKDEAIAKLDISDDEKLAAMQYYAAGQTKEKLAEAVDGGYSFEDIAAFRRMKSELGKKSEMEKSYEDYGLRWSVYKDLYKIFS